MQAGLVPMQKQLQVQSWTALVSAGGPAPPDQQKGWHGQHHPAQVLRQLQALQQLLLPQLPVHVAAAGCQGGLTSPTEEKKC